MLAEPTRCPATIPDADTFATAVSLLLHLAVRFARTLPAESAAVTLS
jgi:hypothetical protein